MPLWQLREYLTADGVSPFSKWRNTLSAQMRARLDRIVERFADGNLGDHKGIGEGVIESRIHTGAGYRIYYGREGETILILLAGGTKQAQSRDIRDAKERWKDYKCRRQNES